jgi:hypothetical protein
MEPRILGENYIGFHNTNLEESIERVEKSKMYRDLSTVIICPTRGLFPTRIVQSWMKLLRPMNQLVAGPIFGEGMDVDHSYNALFRYVLDNDFLKKFKYVLTIEEDNAPPPEGLLKLYENIDEYDVIAGLYWHKSKDGFPMLFGDPNEDPLDVKPQVPKYNEIQRVNALGMGFNLFKLDMFRNIPEPWFKTLATSNVEDGNNIMTQDIYFYRKAAELGYKFACDNRVLVGHYSAKEDQMY